MPLRNRDQSVRTYLVRRFRRIYPPYWAAMLIYAFVIVVVECVVKPGFLSSGVCPVETPWMLGGWRWLGNVTLTETWRAHVFGARRLHLISASWTLCYEEQFYLVVGMFLWLAPRRLFLASAVLTSAIAVAHVCFPSFPEAAAGFFFDGQWFLFAAGIVVFYDINYATRLQSWALRLLLVACAALSISKHFFHPHMSPGFIFALLIVPLHRWDEWLSSRRWLKPLVFCGAMCYSIYLIHELVVRFVGRGFEYYGPSGDLIVLLAVAPLSVAITIAAGWAFHVAVEKRFLNKPSESAPRSAPASAPSKHGAEPAVISE